MATITLEIRREEYYDLKGIRECFSSTFLANHGRYYLGDKENPEAGNHGSYEADFIAYLKEYEDLKLSDVIYLPVYMYEHSGVTISTTPFSCSWDSGQLGYIFEKKETIRKNHNVSRISKKLKEQIEDDLRNEISIYSEYAEGNIFSIDVVSENEEDDYGEDGLSFIVGEEELKKEIEFLTNHYASIGNFIEIEDLR